MAFVENFIQNLSAPVKDLAKWFEEEHQAPIN
jgi:hypothetical protein